MNIIKQEDDILVYIKDMDESDKAAAFDELMEKVLEIGVYDANSALRDESFLSEVPYIVSSLLEEHIVTEIDEQLSFEG